MLPPPKAQDDVTVLPTKEGARYVNVRGGRSASATGLRTKWKRTARRACAGEYVVISEDRSEQRTAGMVSSRAHEGYVRCVDPEHSMPEPKAKRAL